jgi:hypothetical protein
MHYDVWDTDINKYLGRFTEDADVFAMVRTLIDHYGPEYAESLSIGRVSGDGTILPPITGDELLKRVGISVPDLQATSEESGHLIALPKPASQGAKEFAAKSARRG